VTTRLRIEEQRLADITIVRLKGRIEVEEGVDALRDYLNDLVKDGRVRLVLDLNDVTRLDSAGIGVLAAKFLTTARRGGAIKLLHLTERTAHLMQITKLTSVFEIFDDENDALRSFGVRPASTT
jgi:anti-sigma B factor antagonist